MDGKIEQKIDVGQKIIELIRIKGPVIPVQIAKIINSNILMSSAHLSELSSEGKIKISNVKVGGSPLYYLPGQESFLQKFSSNLHEKERKAFELLREKKILRDLELEPVIRVALREIKDFAIPLQVTYQNNKEIFWRWYLLSKEESESLIKELLTKREIPEIKKEEKIEEAIKKEIKKPEEKIVKEEKPKEIKRFIDKEVFSEEINSYFNKNKIIVKNSEIIRKNTEIDFILEVPSAVGSLEYYCKAKNKQRINDGDLSSAYVQGQIKKLPILFLTKGELTKRAKEMLDKEFKNININKI